MPATQGAPRRRRGAGGVGTRAAAGALRIGNAIGEALGSRRLHGPAERRLMISGAMTLALLGVAAIVFPKAIAWPFGLLSAWMGVALLARALRRKGRAAAQPPVVIRSREERT